MNSLSHREEEFPLIRYRQRKANCTEFVTEQKEMREARKRNNKDQLNVKRQVYKCEVKKGKVTS